MGNREVNLTKRVNTATGLRYCPVVLSGNGRVKPDHVLVDGKPERHTEGAYYLEWRDGSKRVRLSVGKDANDAQARRLRKEAELNARLHGVEVTSSDGPVNADRVSLLSAIATYIEDIKMVGRKEKTVAAYTTALNYFVESLAGKKTFLDQIERRDMLQFIAFLREKKHQSPRSVYNKFENVMGFLKTREMNKIVGKNDWPRFVEEDAEVYERETMDVFFAACDETERTWFEFFLMTGMREQEVMYCEWADVNLQHSTVKVSWKQSMGFQPKNYKERQIPVPLKLVERLKIWKEKRNKNCALLFPTGGCNPKQDFLDACKTVAGRAGFNEDDFWLHKFRATFATWHLWAGVDLRTVQSWLGHTDLKSTMRYLMPARNQAAQDKVNNTFA